MCWYKAWCDFPNQTSDRSKWWRDVLQMFPPPSWLHLVVHIQLPTVSTPLWVNSPIVNKCNCLLQRRICQKCILFFTELSFEGSGTCSKYSLCSWSWQARWVFQLSQQSPHTLALASFEASSHVYSCVIEALPSSFLKLHCCWAHNESFQQTVGIIPL